MEIKKVTSKYELAQEGTSYVVNFGNVKKFEDKSVTLQVSGVNDSSLLSVKTTCGCTEVNKDIVDKNTANITLKYNDCASTFAKTNILKYDGKQLTTIILKGACQQ